MRSSAYSPGTGKPGPLIGSPVSHDSGEAGETGVPQSQSSLRS